MAQITEQELIKLRERARAGLGRGNSPGISRASDCSIPLVDPISQIRCLSCLLPIKKSYFAKPFYQCKNFDDDSLFAVAPFTFMNPSEFVAQQEFEGSREEDASSIYSLHLESDEDEALKILGKLRINVILGWTPFVATSLVTWGKKAPTDERDIHSMRFGIRSENSNSQNEFGSKHPRSNTNNGCQSQ